MNTRTSFVNQIDEHEFHYIDNKSIQVGLKGLTFENRYSTFTPKYGSPNMIIVQDNFGQKAKFLIAFVIAKLQDNSALHFKIGCYPKENDFQNRTGDRLLLLFHES